VPAPPRHVTISGDLGSGKSSVAGELAGMLGFPVVSTGSLQREIASSLQMSTLEANLHAENDWSIDDRIDGMTVRVAREATSGIVFDSRMAWHFVPGALKVRLTVDPYVAAERVVGRGAAAAEHYGSVDEAFDAILQRSASEGRRFQAIYGIDVALLANFDLVIDTSAITVAEAAVTIAEAHARPADSQRVLVCPRTVIPAFGWKDGAGRPWTASGQGGVPVVHARPFNFALGGAQTLVEALARGDGVIPADVVAEGDQAIPGGGTASSMMGEAGRDPAVQRWEADHGLNFAGLRHYLASHPEDWPQRGRAAGRGKKDLDSTGPRRCEKGAGGSTILS
jgi:predicted cytidylate kinase